MVTRRRTDNTMVTRRRTDNTMVTRKRTNGQTNTRNGVYGIFAVDQFVMRHYVFVCLKTKTTNTRIQRKLSYRTGIRRDVPPEASQ
jgi:hypothetical protein